MKYAKAELKSYVSTVSGSDTFVPIAPSDPGLDDDIENW